MVLNKFIETKMEAMKILLSLGLMLLLHFGLLGQGNYLQIISPKDQKELFIKEGKRIRILTHTGQKIAGRYSVKDAQTIIIKGQEFLLSDIAKIKRDGLLYHAIMISAIFLATSIATVVLYYSYSTDWSMIVFFTGVYGVLKTPNILKGYKQSDGIQYRIITDDYRPGISGRHENRIR